MSQTTEITFTDKYGEERRIRRNSEGLHLKRARVTPVQTLSQAVSTLVGRRIRDLRIERGYTLEELATRASLATATPKERMWRIENSLFKEGVTLGTLYSLALALDVEMAALLPPLAEIKQIAHVKPASHATVVVRAAP